MTVLVERAPGLHLRSVESDPIVKPDGAVAAFVGVAERGPLDAPQPVRNWGEFTDLFGGVWGSGVMAESVYAFFQNGGSTAYVVRVGRELAAAAPSPCPGQELLEAARNVAPIVDAYASETLRLKARNPGRWGNAVRAHFRSDALRDQELAKLSGPSLLNAAQVQVDFIYDFRVGGEVRLIHRDNALAHSRHLVTAIDVAQSRLSIDPPAPHAYPTGTRVLGPGFVLEIVDGQRRELFDGLSMNPASPRYFVDIVNGGPELGVGQPPARGSSLVWAEHVLGPGGVSRFKPADTAPNAVEFAGGGDGIVFAHATLDDASNQPSLGITAKLRGQAGNSLRVRSEPFGGRIALAVLPTSSKDLIVVEDVRGWVPGDTLRIIDSNDTTITETAVIATVDPSTHVLTLLAPLVNDYSLFSAVAVEDRFNLHIEQIGTPGDAEPPFHNLAMTPGPRFAPDLVDSELVCVHAIAGNTAPPVGEVILTGGQDPGEMEIRRYTGYLDDGSYYLPGGAAQAPIGLAALERVADVNLVCMPDVAALPIPFEELLGAHRQLLFHCEKLGERFALLDPPLGMGLIDASGWSAQLQIGNLPRFGAAYLPWVVAVVEDQNRMLPPSGTVAGLIARADATAGVGRAPANFDCKGVVGLELDIDASEQGILNERGINCIRKFESGAIRLYGARTLSEEPSHLYVNNRRLVAAVVKALSRNLLWSVFEPNDEMLRRRIRDSLDGYFQGLLRKGLMAGDSPGEAYYIKVGAELEGPIGSRPEGELLAEVGIALAQPAEFIVISVKRRPEIMALVEEET